MTGDRHHAGLPEELPEELTELLAQIVPPGAILNPGDLYNVPSALDDKGQRRR